MNAGLALEDVGVIEANVDSPASVDNMTKQAKVVINCVGPYIKFGEVVVKSCIENGANHVDISGNFQFTFLFCSLIIVSPHFDYLLTFCMGRLNASHYK